MENQPNKVILKKIIQILFIIFWVSLILIFLYLPKIKLKNINTRSINIYTWPDFLQHERVAPFEKLTGIKVNINYYENNNEILTKLNLTKGSGIDLVAMTDDVVQKSIKNNLLQKIDKKQLNFWPDIRPEFKNLPNDPTDEYSIAYSWDIYGIGYSKKFFNYQIPIASWKILFDPNIKNIAMTNEPYENICIALQYLYKDKANNLQFTPEILEAIKNTLIAQKKHLEAYTDLRVDYLLTSGTSPAGVTQSSYIKRAMEYCDDIGFIIPEEGSFLVVDSLVIPKGAQNINDVYQLINFLNSYEELKYLTDNFGFLSARNSVLDDTDLSYMGKLEDLIAPEKFKKFGFFYQNLPQNVINKLWIDVKSQ